MNLAALASLALLFLAPDLQADLTKADRQFGREKWAEAAAGYAKVTAADPAQGGAWYKLGYSWHHLGEYEKACLASERASAFPEYRPAALYNLACAQTLLGRIDEGGKTLDAALAAGFFDYDTMAVDTDIAGLRDAGKVSFAPKRQYTDFKARNGVECGYEVLLPQGHDAAAACRAVVCFPPGIGRERCADWFTHEVLGTEARKAGWIIVVLVAPERGWQNHPGHHALEGLLKQVRKDHAIDGKFHALGYADGARSAATYSRMSRKYFGSLTTISSRSWARWDKPGKSFRDGMPVHLVVGEEDTPALGQARAVQEDITAKKGRCRLTVIPGNGRLLEALRGAALLEAVPEPVNPRAPK